jgi:hypothetical protein
MKQTRFLFTTLAIFALLFTYGSLAQAQATRTWVSGVGDDANPCSRTAPCKTFAGAISKTAAGGEINVLDPGGFGVVTITKSITILSDGAIGGILFAGTNGVIINAGVNDVITLKGLEFEGVGTGLNAIRFLAGAQLVVEDCIFRDASQKGIDFEPSTNNAQLFVNNSTFINFNNVPNGGAILVKPPAGVNVKAVLNNVRMVKNLYGLRAEDRSTVMVENSIASENTNNGFLAFSVGGAVDMSIDNSVASNNGVNGIGAQGNAAAIARISRNTVTGNGTGLSIGAAPSGQIISYRNNNVSGNTVDGAPTTSLPAPGTI